MSIRATVVGSYPKVTDQGIDNLPVVMDRWQRKLVTEAHLDEEIQRVIRRVIKEQEEAGLDLITDGQIRWEDLVHPITRCTSKIKRGTLRRFFDNNVYYRRLELPALSPPAALGANSGEGNGDVRWEKSALMEEFRFASQVAARPVKVALPGPLTLAVSTERNPLNTQEGLLDLYTGLLRKEVEALVASGARQVQLDEPAFAPGEPLLSKAVESINRIFQDLPKPGVEARVHRWVAFYFHDISGILREAAGLKVDLLSLDLVSARERAPDLIPKIVGQLRDGIWRGGLALGLVDARNTKLESVDKLKVQIGEFANAIPPDRLWLSPNCGLEFLPHGAALKKLRILSDAAH